MIRKFLLVLSALFLLASCQKAPEITLSSNYYEFETEGGSIPVTFTANRDWRVNCSESWLSISPSSGTGSDSPVTVTARCDEYLSSGGRWAQATIEVDGLSKTIEFLQKSYIGVIVRTKEYDIPPEGNTSSGIKIDVELANVRYYNVTASDDWIHLGYRKEGMKITELGFSVEKNQTYESREGTITLVPEKGDTQVIHVRQAANEGFVLNGMRIIEVDKNGGTVELDFKTNVEFDTEINADWIHLTQTRGLSDHSITLTIDKNETSANRSCEVTLHKKGGTASTTYTFRQACPVAVPEAVDLGLSVKWASFNLGATKPEELGYSYAWGETVPKDDYSRETYKWYDCSEGWPFIIKYNSDKEVGNVDKKTILALEDDAANVNLGGNWRMPTNSEMKELFSSQNCEKARMTINGVVGYRFSGKKAGFTDHWIFIPLSRSYGLHFSLGSSTRDASNAYAASIEPDINGNSQYLYREEARYVRPVINK